MRFSAPSALLCALLLGAPCLPLASCGGGGGASSTSLAASDEQVVVSSGAREIAADSAARDIVPAGERSRLGIGAPSRTWTITTPSNAALDLALSGILPGARGAVTVRVALAGGASGSAAQDLRAAGLSIRAGNLIDRGAWLESVGDGFARLTLSGAIGARQVLVVERVSEGKRSLAAVDLVIGPPGPANPTLPGTTSYAGIKSSTTIYGSDAPLFGMPAIAGSGDRVSLTVYDSVYAQNPGGGTYARPGTGFCVMPDIERRQRRFQLDTVTGATTMGETDVQGNDATSWRDTETAGLYNVIAIAQSGGAGVKLSLSLDRGATFPSETHFDAGMWTHLSQVTVGEDYSLALIYWTSDVDGTARLVVVEGTPSGFDAGGSPSGYAFGAPAVLLERRGSVMPLVSDARYSSCGDLFIATGYMQTIANPAGAGWLRTTEVLLFRRPQGHATFEKPTTIDEMQIVGFDPSLAILGCGDTAQVYVAYEADQGVRIARSTDGGRTFAKGLDVGTTSANAPQVFARHEGGKDVVDCLFVDGSEDALGSDLCLLRADADLATNRSLHRILKTTLVPPPAGGAPTEIESLGWMGFDATALDGDIYVAVHTQRQEYYAPGSFVVLGGAGGVSASSAGAPAAPPKALYPGMTQPVPAPNPSAANKLGVIRLE